MPLEKLIPENFREVLAAFLFLVGILFSFASLWKTSREHNLRMSGLFLLASLLLFSHNPYCYFAGLFIVATAVTQLEFLQNLAAIIRGSKEYFDYKKEFLSQREVERSIEKEIKEIENATSEPKDAENQDIKTLEIDVKNLNASKFGVLVEDYTFRFLEKKYQRPIQRYVRFTGKGKFVEFDGIVQMENVDLIFEVKSSRKGQLPLSYASQVIKRLITEVKEYEGLTKRSASLRFVLIGNYETGYSTRLVERVDVFLGETRDLDIIVEIYTFEEIGLPDFAVIADNPPEDMTSRSAVPKKPSAS